MINYGQMKFWMSIKNIVHKIQIEEFKKQIVIQINKTKVMVDLHVVEVYFQSKIKRPNYKKP